MTDNNVTIRRMEKGDMEKAVAWAALEGWNPGLHDAGCFYAADPNGFFLAELNGEPTGCISAVRYDDKFGFMGFYIVRPELRQHGIGMALWDAAMAYMGGRTIGADGVVNMLDKYALSGFRIAHNNARYEGRGKAYTSSCQDISHIPFDTLEQYDRRFFQAPRREFLKQWISRPGTSGKCVMDGENLAGYGVIRPCHTGFKIAPLFAGTPAIAEELFRSLSSLAAGEPIYLDIPVCNSSALDMVNRHGMGKVFETARIYRGDKHPELPLDDIYGITSFELG